MTSATLQISITPKRMLDKKESARHCGRSDKRFEIECPVRPIVFGNGDRRFDVNDLDAWLDSLKVGTSGHDADDIVARLGT